ncbi:MAG: hypothetical protein FWE06_00655 [Oscillospiraceae bacterium]|nr:hypothetical protein [Oscillospiraceae bacterium]
MKMRSGVAVIVGLIIIGFTTAAYFLLDLGNNAGFERAFLFLWASQIVCFGGIAVMGSVNGRTITRSGVSAVLMAYFLATLVFTPFAGLLADNLNWLTLMQLLIIAIALIALVIVGFATIMADSSNYNPEADHVFTQKCGKRIFKLMQSPQGRKFEMQLKALHAQIQSLEIKGISAADNAVAGKVGELEDFVMSGVEAADGEIEELTAAVIQAFRGGV